MTKIADGLVDFLRSGEWIDKMSPIENLLLADFLKTSMAKQRKKVAFAERLKDGVIYVVYNIKYRKNDLKYNTDVLLVLKENNMLLLKHREITPLFGKKIDMLPYIRMDKIKRIKNNIYNKNIIN